MKHDVFISTRERAMRNTVWLRKKKKKNMAVIVLVKSDWSGQETNVHFCFVFSTFFSGNLTNRFAYLNHNYEEFSVSIIMYVTS